MICEYDSDGLQQNTTTPCAEIFAPAQVHPVAVAATVDNRWRRWSAMPVGETGEKLDPSDILHMLLTTCPVENTSDGEG